MAGAKAEAATQGIRELIMECQARGPLGVDRSIFNLILIRFDDSSTVDPDCDMVPVDQIDPERIRVTGDGGGTNIMAALQLTLDRLRAYLHSLQPHPEKVKHPLPLVILFSDGEHTGGPAPKPIADEIKNLSLDGVGIIIVAAGISLEGSQPDEEMLREIASPDCYVPISNTKSLVQFISLVGSAGVCSAKDMAATIKAMMNAELGMEEPTKPAEPPIESTRLRVLDDNVQFTVYRPQAVRPFDPSNGIRCWPLRTCRSEHPILLKKIPIQSRRCSGKRKKSSGARPKFIRT